jgi:hypothetical protein
MRFPMRQYNDVRATFTAIAVWRRATSIKLRISIKRFVEPLGCSPSSELSISPFYYDYGPITVCYLHAYRPLEGDSRTGQIRKRLLPISDKMRCSPN